MAAVECFFISDLICRAPIIYILQYKWLTEIKNWLGDQKFPDKWEEHNVHFIRLVAVFFKGMIEKLFSNTKNSWVFTVIESKSNDVCTTFGNKLILFLTYVFYVWSTDGWKSSEPSSFEMTTISKTSQIREMISYKSCK